MSTLLIQGCSKSKNRVTEPTPAIELYAGYFFKIIKKSIRDGEITEDCDICILSAEYGIVDANVPIDPYDRRMDTERARELASPVSKTLCQKYDGSYDRIVFNLGKTYRIAMNEFVEQSSTSLYQVDGAGIGEKGHVLKRFLRGDDSMITQYELTAPASD